MEIVGFTVAGSIEIVLDGVAMTVPNDPANRHRQLIAAREGLGNTIPAYVAPPAPPATDQSITKRQLVAALIVGAGRVDPDDMIEAAIAAIADPVNQALALNDWRNAPYYVRTHQLFNDPDLLAAVGLNADAVDALWALAVTLPK